MFTVPKPSQIKSCTTLDGFTRIPWKQLIRVSSNARVLKLNYPQVTVEIVSGVKIDGVDGKGTVFLELANDKVFVYPSKHLILKSSENGIIIPFEKSQITKVYELQSMRALEKCSSRSRFEITDFGYIYTISNANVLVMLTDGPNWIKRGV